MHNTNYSCQILEAQIMKNTSWKFSLQQYLMFGLVSWPTYLRYKRYILNCTISCVLVFIMTSSSRNGGNIKHWISQEQNMTLPWNKKSVHLKLSSFCKSWLFSKKISIWCFLKITKIFSMHYVERLGGKRMMQIKIY